ncbi:MAG: single-stranded DNA-binding protein [Bacteroidia bacterium]
MKSLNRVTLIGNLGKDPEYQMPEGNIAVAKFTMATSETFKDKDGVKQTQVEWHNIVLWRSLAEVAHKFLHKGSLVFIEGKLKTRHYDDKEGNKKYVVEIIGEQLIMLDKKTGGEIKPAGDDETGQVPQKNNDLPF